MANQTIPDSNGDYVANAVPTNWKQIPCAKLPAPFLSTILMFSDTALMFSDTALSFTG